MALCYGLPEMLEEANQTNCLSEKIPHVVFNAAMFELALFLKDDARAHQDLYS